MAFLSKGERLLILEMILTVKKNLMMMIQALCRNRFLKVRMLQAANLKENQKLKMMAARQVLKLKDKKLTINHLILLLMWMTVKRLSQMKMMMKSMLMWMFNTSSVLNKSKLLTKENYRLKSYNNSSNSKQLMTMMRMKMKKKYQVHTIQHSTQTYLFQAK